MDLKQQIRSNRLAGIGSALMALDQGRVPDLSGYMANHAALQGQLPMGDGGTVVDGGYESQDLTKNAALMGRFTPEQRALLAQMPRGAALKAIEEVIFSTPDPSQQFVSQMMTGDVMSKFTPEQRTALAAMPPAAAQQLLMDTIFSKPADPMKQIELEKAQLELAQMQNPARPMKQGADDRWRYTDGEKEMVFPDVQIPEEKGYAQITAEQAQQRGLDPNKQWQVGPNGRVSQIGGGGTSVTVNNAGDAAPVPAYPKAPNGFMYVRDPASGDVVLNEQGIATMAPIIGGPKDNSAQEGVKADRASTASDVVTNAARLARLAASERGPFPSLTTQVARLPWTDSAEVVRHVEVLRAQAAGTNLQQMRDASPTGGALGNVTEKEIALLENLSGALNPNSPTFLRDLDQYERTLLRTIHGVEAGDLIFEQSRSLADGSDQGVANEGWTDMGGGIRIRVKP